MFQRQENCETDSCQSVSLTNCQYDKVSAVSLTKLQQSKCQFDKITAVEVTVVKLWVWQNETCQNVSIKKWQSS